MTDINKQIEEALKNKVKNCKNSTAIFDTRDYLLFDDAVDIMTSILSQYVSDTSLADTVRNLIHSSRWRKVSEVMPEVNVQVLVKTNNGKYSISEMYIPKDCNGNILGDKEWKGSFSFKCSIIEWKPID